VRICFIANANSVHSARWITPFVKRGDQVHLLSPKPVVRTWKGLADLVDLSQVTNIRKVRFAVWGVWVRNYLRQTKPDIVHAHHLTGAGWLGALANFHPFVVTSWGSDILVEPNRSSFRRLLIKIVLHRSDRLTVPSRLMYDAALGLGMSETRLRLIPWGVETDVFKPTPEDRFSTRSRLGVDMNAKVVFSPRAIDVKYNVDVVLEAFSMVASRIPEARLVLLRYNVDPDYLSRAEQLIETHRLGGAVLWLPHQQTSDDMARLYRAADATISIPSSEGYGFTVYEAMASGCPTLVSDLPVFEGEMANHIHTLKVPVRNTSKTAHALFRLLTDSSLQTQLRAEALDICRSKSVGERIRQTDALYQEVLAQP